MALLALALVVWSGTATPTPAAETQPRRHIREIHRPAPQPTPKEREWLERAIDQILRGD